jgi:DNA-binding transcriptional LysR family regulator
MSADLNLKWLSSFCALAEHGSFAAAAEALQISQPTVSAHLAALEAKVRAQLVWRTTRKVRLTPSGRRFLVHAQRVRDDLANAVLELRDQAALQRGRVVLACMPTLAGNIVPSAVAEFCGRYPGISVTVVDRPSKIVEGLVRDGEADVGIGSKPEWSASLSYESLSTDRFVAILPADSRWANAKAVKLAELAGEPLIALAPSPSIRRIVEEVFTGAGLSFEPKFQVARQTTALGMAEARLGIALIPESGLPRPLTRKLRALPLRPEIIRSYGIIRRRGDPLSPPAAELIKFLRRGLKSKGAGPARTGARRLIGKADE